MSGELINHRPKEVKFSMKFFDYSLRLDHKGKNRLLFILPGMGSNTRSQDTALRMGKRDLGMSFGYHSLTAKFTESKFDSNRAIDEMEQLIGEISSKYGLEKLILMGSSFGSGYALSLAQKMSKERTRSIDIDGLILMMPCVNDTSVKAGAIPILKTMPPFLAKGVLTLGYRAKSLVGNVIGDNFDSGGTIESKYQRLMSIPRLSRKPIDPNIPVHLFLSAADFLIDNEKVIKDVTAIAGSDNAFIHEVYPTGVNNHDFRPQEWIKVGKALILPLLRQMWKV